MLQHTPSTQLPLPHSAASVHAAPLTRLVHAPEPLQSVVPTHSFAGSVPFGMLVHAPRLPATLHAWQRPPHALLQQTPSTQLALEHWLPPVHALPLPSLATH